MRDGARTLYLAYGSNLDTVAMAIRAPKARVVGKATIEDWGLAFRLHADIEPCRGRKVPVLVWEIGQEDEERLDMYEGFPRYYVKRDFRVTMTDLDGGNPTDITAMAYVMLERRRLREPSYEYYMILHRGYKEFGFDDGILRHALLEAQKGGAR